jgi:hypothetical protein
MLGKVKVVKFMNRLMFTCRNNKENFPLTLKVLNVEANRRHRDGLSIIFIFEEVYNCRFSRIIKANDQNTNLFRLPLFI